LSSNAVAVITELIIRVHHWYGFLTVYVEDHSFPTEPLAQQQLPGIVHSGPVSLPVKKQSINQSINQSKNRSINQHINK
jgi:hypothetical protein